MNKRYHLNCDCGTKSHVVTVDINEDDYIISVFMENSFLNFYGRFKNAMKYLFKINNSNYEYVDVMLDEESIEKLKQSIKDYEELKGKK